MIYLSAFFFIAAAVGIAIVILQAFMVVRFLRREGRKPTQTPGISILKPLCGIDDDLEDNLRSFSALDYPDYEVILGVRNERDLAYPVAQRVVARWPRRFRLVIQEGEPGLNPKVNQLITLSKAARHQILVVSDSNVRVEQAYLADTVAQFEDPDVVLVTHPVAGVGERSLGSLCDNLHMTSHISAGQIGVKELANQDLVIGKSMAFRRADLDALGGFASCKDVLAEDYVLGRRIASELGKRVAVGRFPVLNVTQHRSVGDFLRRYQRWAVMQRKAVGYGTYTAMVLSYPLFLAMWGYLAHPSLRTMEGLLLVALVKTGVDLAQGRMLRPGGFPAWAAFAVPLTDVVIGLAWMHGLLHDRVQWRGHVLEVTEGTVLVPIGRPEQAVGNTSIAGHGHVAAR